MVNGQWIRKCMEGCGRGLMCFTIIIFLWTIWGGGETTKEALQYVFGLRYEPRTSDYEIDILLSRMPSEIKEFYPLFCRCCCVPHGKVIEIPIRKFQLQFLKKKKTLLNVRRAVGQFLRNKRHERGPQGMRLQKASVYCSHIDPLPWQPEYRIVSLSFRITEYWVKTGSTKAKRRISNIRPYFVCRFHYLQIQTCYIYTLLPRNED